MINLTLKQLRYSLALADEGHFNKAAKRCHVTQPALSQQIKLLEQNCGALLFERVGKSVKITPFGQEFLERARAIIKDTEALAVFSSSHDGAPSRPIRFGIIPTVAPYLLPNIYPALKNALADMDFVIKENHTEQLLEAIESGDVDLALIATDPPEGSRLTVAPLFADPFVLATQSTAQYPTPTRLEELPKERILLLDEGHCFRDQAIAACALGDTATKRAFAATSLSTIVEFVANGQGITLLPTISLKKEAADPRIKIIPLAAPGAGRMLSLVWRDATPFSGVFEEIAGVIKSAAEEIQTSNI